MHGLAEGMTAVYTASEYSHRCCTYSGGGAYGQ